jgi:hypothetical protein
MITLNGLEIRRDSIAEVCEENGLYYVYTTDYIKICITKEEYEDIINN